MFVQNTSMYVLNTYYIPLSTIFKPRMKNDPKLSASIHLTPNEEIFRKCN